MRGIRITFLALVMAGPAIAQTEQDPTTLFSGLWWNERCSTIELKVEQPTTGEFVLSGTFTTGVGSGTGSPHDVTGYVSNDLIAFSAALGDTGSLTSWTGQHTMINGTETVVTQWLLAANLSEDAKEPDTLWRSLWTGADNFVRQKPSTCP